MTEAGHVWITTEQALDANNCPDGILGLQLEHASNEKGHIRVRNVVHWILFVIMFVPDLLPI